MRKENILVIVLAVIVVAGLGYYLKKDTSENKPLISQGGIEWKDYSQGMTLAQEQGKPVFLYFYADW
jgi:thiol:disulfide interchange protein